MKIWVSDSSYLLYIYCSCNNCAYVCLFFRSWLRNPWTNLPQILFGELGRPTGMFWPWFLGFKLSGSTLTGKIAKIIIYDEGRVNGGTKLWLSWATLSSQASFYIYKVVISVYVCLFVGPIITQKPGQICLKFLVGNSGEPR